MKFETVLQHLIASFERAKDTEFVYKPMSYALYQTWRWCDKKEKPRQLKTTK